MLVVDYLLVCKILMSVNLHLSSTIISYNMTVLIGQSGDPGPPGLQGPQGSDGMKLLSLYCSSKQLPYVYGDRRKE